LRSPATVETGACLYLADEDVVLHVSHPSACGVLPRAFGEQDGLLRVCAATRVRGKCLASVSPSSVVLLLAGLHTALGLDGLVGLAAHLVFEMGAVVSAPAWDPPSGGPGVSGWKLWSPSEGWAPSSNCCSRFFRISRTPVRSA